VLWFFDYEIVNKKQLYRKICRQRCCFCYCCVTLHATISLSTQDVGVVALPSDSESTSALRESYPLLAAAAEWQLLPDKATHQDTGAFARPRPYRRSPRPSIANTDR